MYIVQILENVVAKERSPAIEAIFPLIRRLPRPAENKCAGLATTVLIVKVEKNDLGSLRTPPLIGAHH
jgi:hypothetical protein